MLIDNQRHGLQRHGQTGWVLGRALLLGGPAGAGKSTLARAWCESCAVAAHVQLDDVRSLIVRGLVDPLDATLPGQTEQWLASVEAACAVARSFVNRGIDVAIDDLMSPQDVDGHWRPLLAGVTTNLIIVLARRDVVLDRGRRRTKVVPEPLVEQQFEVSSSWAKSRVLDTSDLTVAQSLEKLVRLMEQPASSI